MIGHITQVTDDTTTVSGNQWGADETTRTDCCGADVTWIEGVLCCRACYRAVLHQELLAAIARRH